MCGLPWSEDHEIIVTIFSLRAAGGAMSGSFLDGEQVRKLEKMPTKKELITAIAVMVKKVRARILPLYDT